MKVVIVDYGMGNIKSIISALKYLNVDNVLVSNKHTDILNADKLVLPGVGSFAKAMDNINQLEIGGCLKKAVMINKKPILGICLGMQLMCECSEEDSLTNGFGFVSGKVKRFNIQNQKVPHVGFNQVKINNGSRLYENLEDSSDFYFTHSYKLNKNKNNNESLCTYGVDFVASYEVNNIVGVQFHPELSQTNGLKLLDNFFEKF